MPSDRRPNPPGWVPPKAPYNPYDPMDQRPAEGYPSEFKTPGKPRNWTMIPQAPSNYRQVKEQLKRLNYTPRPPSDLYPGQFKVLKRRNKTGFNTGVKMMAKLSTWGIIVGAVFFYRWNDGYDNVFSYPYRMQLWLRQQLFGKLSPQQEEDLEGKQKGMVKKANPIEAIRPTDRFKPDEEPIAFERPSKSHVIEAERIMQEREEAILRAVDIAEAKSKQSKKSSSWWSF